MKREREAYSASKGGISSLTHALAMSLSPEIKVNSITPGWINTNERLSSNKKWQSLQHPSGRVGTPWWCGRCCSTFTKKTKVL